MESTEFAIVDIETTGGYAAAAGITEIAILLFDGEQITERFTSLVRPDQPIPLHIQALTGITDEMVESAPSFSEIAPAVFTFLNRRVFVAHNVHFDYSFLQAALQNAGFSWNSPRLCTVRLSRKVFPNLPSYSLGRLCASLAIPLYERHRAGGDAEATAILFKKIYQEDPDGHIQRMMKPRAKEQRLPTQIPSAIWDKLPISTGVYQFWDRQGKIIYVGKANNIRRRVIGHFTGNNTSLRRQQFLNEIVDITFEETGTELGALLKECHLIKTHWPKHNRALKKFEPRYGLVEYEDLLGYRRLSVVQLQKQLQPIVCFESVAESTQFLLNIIATCKLERSLCQFYGEKPIRPQQKKSGSAATLFPSPAVHNLLLKRALEVIEKQKRSFLVLTAGRSPEERCFIYVHENQVHAMGFVSECCQINEITELIKPSHRLRSNYYMNHLVDSYARRHPEQTFSIPSKITEAASLPFVLPDPLESWKP